MPKLDATYSPVLDQLLVDLTQPAKDNIIREFRVVIGSIIILVRPVSTAGLSCLLGIDKAVISNRLDLLHLVLDIPSDENAPVNLLHLSFRGFLLDDERKRYQFWVDGRATHEKLATKCLHLLMNNDSLKKDICGLQMPGTLREDVHRQTIDSCVPSKVQYACLYWVHHLKGSRVRFHVEHQTFHFLQHHFLHWLEVLGLIGRISESIGLIDDLQSLVNVSQPQSHASVFAKTINSPIMVPKSCDFFRTRGVLSSTAAQQLTMHRSSSTPRPLSLLQREALFERYFRNTLAR